jgi:multimeric flavodoxin WrbA/protein-tyrosine-phosphatase
MFILGLQGSPRKKGNTSILLSSFLTEAERLGAHVHNLEVAEKKIHPCIGCGHCEKKGSCVFKDEMTDVYALLRRADLIVMAAPIFFYNVPAQLKALIDRSQTLWSRRYVHKVNDPGQKWRTGIFLSVGATKGKNLFEGVTLTAKYFFDAVGARYDGGLTFRHIEEAGAIAQHPTALEEAKEKASSLVKSLLDRKKILFLCTENSCRSQMASAFAQHFAGDRIEVESAGSSPAVKVNEVMVQAMQEKGIDMAFRKPKSTAEVASSMSPDLIVSMGCEKGCPVFPDAPYQDWNLPDPAEKPIGFMREIRDTIEEKVRSLIETV